MQCAGYQFFAGTGLAVDKDGDIAVRQSSNGSKDFLHGRCLADNLSERQFFRCGGVAAFLSRVGERPLGNCNYLV